MIVYDSNSAWFRDIFNSFKSTTLIKLFVRILGIGAVAGAAIYFTHPYLDHFSIFNTNHFTWIGVALSILMVFRTNTAYDRWWEGRKQWGRLVNTSRSIALLVNSKLPIHDETNRRYFARNISNYAYALSGHLRGVFRKELLYDVDDNDEKSLEVHKHAPNYIAKKLYNRTVRLLERGQLSEFIELKMLDHLAEFNEITGACERIKSTPIPFSYRTYLKIFIFIYIALLPFAYMESLGFYAALLSMAQAFLILGLEMMAEEIEDPFENNRNDLPTRHLSDIIRNNVYEVLGFYDEVTNPRRPIRYRVLD